MPVSDLIVPERIAEDTYVGKNIGKSFHKGLEISIEKSFSSLDRPLWIYVGDYRFNFTWQSNTFGNFYIENKNLKNNSLPGVPDERMYAMVTLRSKKWFYLEPEIYINGKTAMNDENSRFYESYSIFNIKGGFIFQKNKVAIRLSSAINNVLDKKYASMILINAPAANNRPPRFYYPGLPRNYFISASLRYNL